MDECSGWAYLDETGSCYLFVEEKKNWTDANAYCDKLAPGATLPSIHSSESNHFISSLAGSSTFWIGGLRDITSPAGWKWTDESLWDYQNWNSNQPGHGYNHIVITGSTHSTPNKWYTRNDGSSYGVVCQLSLKYQLVGSKGKYKK